MKFIYPAKIHIDDRNNLVVTFPNFETVGISNSIATDANRFSKDVKGKLYELVRESIENGHGLPSPISSDGDFFTVTILSDDMK